MILVRNIHHASPSEKVFPHLSFSQSLHSTQLRQNLAETLKWIVIHLPWTWKLIMAALIPKWTWCLNALIYLGAAWQSASHPGLNGPDDLSPWKICINSHLLPYWFLSVCNLSVRPGCVFHVVVFCKYLSWFQGEGARQRGLFLRGEVYERSSGLFCIFESVFQWLFTIIVTESPTYGDRFPISVCFPALGAYCGCWSRSMTCF